MSEKNPIGFVGIIPKKILLDAPDQQTVFEILKIPRADTNEIRLYVFCLLQGESISLPKFVTSWIAHLPSDLLFTGRTDPSSTTQYEVWFDKDVICLSDGSGDRETRFLLLDAPEVTIRINNIDYVAAARRTKEEAQTWVSMKTAEVLRSLEQSPS
jgi:hypothetical protein